MALRLLPAAKRQIVTLLVLLSFLPLYWTWMQSRQEKSIRLLLPEKVIVPLKGDATEGRIIFQDYLIDGKSVWYIFTSTEAFKAIAGEMQVAPKLASIKRAFLFTFMRDEDNVYIDPKAESQIITTGKQLRELFPERVDINFKRIDHPISQKGEGSTGL